MIRDKKDAYFGHFTTKFVAVESSKRCFKIEWEGEWTDRKLVQFITVSSNYWFTTFDWFIWLTTFGIDSISPVVNISLFTNAISQFDWMIDDVLAIHFSPINSSWNSNQRSIPTNHVNGYHNSNCKLISPGKWMFDVIECWNLLKIKCWELIVESNWKS